MSKSTVWELEPHTKAKHEIMTSYLKAWFAIWGATPYHKRALVFDGFSGPGIYAGEEPGSPVLALQALLEHSHFDRWDDSEFVFLFNEQNKARHESLDVALGIFEAGLAGQKFPKNVKVHTENASFTSLAEELLASMEGKQLAPTFAFIDPFGYKDVPIDVIKRLLSFERCELFIYFDFNSANRFAGKGAGVDHLFEELFGCDEFYDAPAKGPERGKFLHDLYERQLKEVCNFAHVRSFQMVHRRGHTNNYLFFCTRNTNAFDHMKHAMWKAAPAGDYRFLDRLADQDVLFDDEEVDTAPLRAALLQQFTGQTVTIEQVLRYVICETPYHSSHVKRKTLVPMQKAGLIFGGPNQRRPNTFPEGTQIVFT